MTRIDLNVLHYHLKRITHTIPKAKRHLSGHSSAKQIPIGVILNVIYKPCRSNLMETLNMKLRRKAVQKRNVMSSKIKVIDYLTNRHRAAKVKGCISRLLLSIPFYETSGKLPKWNLVRFCSAHGCHQDFSTFAALEVHEQHYHQLQ